MTATAPIPEIRRLLRQVPELACGSFEAREAAAACLHLRDTRPGERVISKGAPGDALFFVLQGTFEAQLANGTTPTIAPGEFFGEIGLLLGIERTSTVVSRTAGRLLVLPGDHLLRVARYFPRLLRHLESVARERVPDLMENFSIDPRR